MKRSFLLLLAILPIIVILSAACGMDNDQPRTYDNTPNYDPLMNNRDIDRVPDTNNRLFEDGDTPLRNDPEYNDPDNRIIDADRDDRFIDDEDIKVPNNTR